MRCYTGLIAGLAAVMLVACTPASQPPAASEAASAIPPSFDPGLKPAVSATSAAMEEAASPSASSALAQCRAEIGETAAKRLADRCRMVSPATHPPCNIANSCQMIQGEIDRSCAIWDKDTSQPKPRECTA